MPMMVALVSYSYTLAASPSTSASASCCTLAMLSYDCLIASGVSCLTMPAMFIGIFIHCPPWFIQVPSGRMIISMSLVFMW